jgi:exosortase D (VPLPA-CTERM-specific)
MTETNLQGAGRVTPSVSYDRVGPLLMAMLIVAAAAYFQEGLWALLKAWRLPEYSHGPLIPMLSGLLFLRHLKVVEEVRGPVSDRWPGVVLLLAALGLGAIGKFARIDDVVAYALIGFVGGVVLISFGWRRGYPFWPAVLHLVFMLPLPATIYWKLSTFLQSVSSEIGVMLIRAMDIPVFLEGNIIDLGIYKLHVAEACSGLRYLFPIMSFSYIFATLYRGPVWHKAVLLLSAAPLAVLMNSVRIGIIGIVVNYSGIEHVEGITHLLEGWVIFITCVLLLFGLARVMMLLQGTRMTLSEALDLSFEGLGGQIARGRNIWPSSALVFAVIVTAVGAGAWNLLPDRGAPVIDREPLALIPDRMGEWALSTTQKLDPEIERALGADDYVSGYYENLETGGTAEIFMAWYADQTRGGIHSPEVCLPGGGWEMARIERVDIGEVVGRPGDLPINRAIIQKGVDRLLVYYWFEQYGGRTASDVEAKLSLLANAVLYGRTDGALVRMLTPIGSNESVASAEARLNSLLAPVFERLDRFVPRRAD